MALILSPKTTQEQITALVNDLSAKNNGFYCRVKKDTIASNGKPKEVSEAMNGLSTMI